MLTGEEGDGSGGGQQGFPVAVLASPAVAIQAARRRKVKIAGTVGCYQKTTQPKLHAWYGREEKE